MPRRAEVVGTAQPAHPSQQAAGGRAHMLPSSSDRKTGKSGSLQAAATLQGCEYATPALRTMEHRALPTKGSMKGVTSGSTTWASSCTGMRLAAAAAGARGGRHVWAGMPLTGLPGRLGMSLKCTVSAPAGGSCSATAQHPPQPSRIRASDPSNPTASAPARSSKWARLTGVLQAARNCFAVRHIRLALARESFKNCFAHPAGESPQAEAG